MNSIRRAMRLLLLVSVPFQALCQNTQAEKRQFDSVKALAERGDAHAQLTLGTYYFFGTGVSRDVGKAAKWHRKAAEQGLATAQVRVAYEYVNGLGVKADPIEAARWLRRAAEQGLAEAQYELGHCYSEGQGVAENPVEAAKWYRRAADQNLAPAQYALGNCYFDGYGVTKSVPDGVAWTEKAALQGYAPAENSYGMCFAKGKGVPQSYLQAYKWLNLAAAQGGEHNTEAKINLSMAERAMTPEQIAEGQKLAHDFRPTSSQTGPLANEVKVTTTAASGIEPQNNGTVNIRSEDPTAEIYVDGAFVGNTPSKIKMQPGTHVVTVKKAGAKVFQKELKVTEGAELTLNAVFEKQ